MAAAAYIWKGNLLAQARRVYETDSRKIASVAERIGIDKATLYRLAKRHGWNRPVGARVHTRAVWNLYRANPGDQWKPVEIVGSHASGTVCREVGKLWPGVFLAEPSQLSVAK